MDESRLLIAAIEDKYDRFLSEYALVSTDFLSMEQQSEAGKFLREHRGIPAFFYGGFADAERKQLIFTPDYLDIHDEEDMIAYFRNAPDECPQVLLDLSYRAGSGGVRLSHRDYLGSLMGEGIRREKTGDILVCEKGAQIVIARELSEYLAAHYSRAGRTSLDVRVLPVSEVRYTAPEKEVVRLTVSSPRLDNIVTSAFGISRGSAVEAISQGRVFVDGIEVHKPDLRLRGGEKVVLRGKGKVIYKGITGTSKKGKDCVVFEKYTS